MIKKFYMALLVLLSSFILTATVFAANITDVRWGNQDNGNLRVVVDCDTATIANVYTQGQNAVLKVDSKLASNVAANYSMKNPLAKKLTLKKAGNQTLIYIPLEVSATQIDYKVFALKKDSSTNKPNRIVLDLFKKVGSSAKLTKESSAKSKKSDVSIIKTIKMENAATKKVSKKEVPIVLKSASKTIKLEKVSESTKIIAHNDAVYKPLTKNNTNKVSTSVKTNTSIKYVKKDVPLKIVKPNTRVLSKTSSNNSSNYKTASSRGSFKPLSKETMVKPKTTSVKPFKTVSLTKAQARAAKWKALNEKNETSKEKLEKGKVKTIKLNKTDLDKNSHKFRDMVASSNKSSSDSLKGKIIVIDPGHGGNDPGAIGKKGTMEKDITLSVAVKVYHSLVDKGATVYLTRWTDTEVATPNATDSEELQARVNIAKWKKADIFISLHVNASIKRSVGGIATYYYPKTWKDVKLAKVIQNQVTGNLGLADLGIREANFYVNKRSSMTSSLVEMGFISNSKEERLLNSNWFRGKLAKLISQGIEKYFK